MAKYNWIRDEYKIDFELPKFIAREVEELERPDREEDERYFDKCENLEYDAKAFVPEDRMTVKQWETLCNRYDGSV